MFLRGISNNIPPKPRHIFCRGWGGIYCWIYHEKTPYIQYTSHLEGFFWISKYVKKIQIFPFWNSKYVNQILISHSIYTFYNIYPPNGGYIQQYTPQFGIMHVLVALYTSGVLVQKSCTGYIPINRIYQCFFCTWKSGRYTWKKLGFFAWKGDPFREKITKSAREKPILCVKNLRKSDF